VTTNSTALRQLLNSIRFLKKKKTINNLKNNFILLNCLHNGIDCLIMYIEMNIFKIISNEKNQYNDVKI
jgi:hypothetical protein